MTCETKGCGIKDTQARYIDDWLKLHEEQTASVSAHWGFRKRREHKFYSSQVGIKMMDAVYLAEALQILKPQKIFEVGSFIGFSTRWILDKTQDWSAHVTSVDPNVGYHYGLFPCPHDHLKKFNKKHAQRMTIIAAFLSMPYPGFPDTPVITEPFDEYDFAFIDGDHAFESALLNCALAARMMPQGGTIIAHDAISCPEVAPALETLATASPEIDYLIAGTSLYENQSRLSPLLLKALSTMQPHPPLTLSRRKWKRYRAERRRYQKAPVSWACDGLGIIKVRNGQKLDQLDLESLLAKKDAMLPKKKAIVAQRALPADNLASFLSEGEIRS